MQIDPLQKAKDEFKETLTKGSLILCSQIQIHCDDEERFIYQQLLSKWYKNIVNLDFLPKSIKQFEEITIHSPTKITLKGQFSTDRIDCDLTTDDIHLLAEVLVFKYQQDWNFQNPFASFYASIFDTDVRITLIHYSASTMGCSKIFIRILNDKVLPINKYSAPPGLFSKIINEKKNVLIAGATGSGKTTFTNALINLIQNHEHIITIEDTKELIPPTHFTTSLITDNKTESKSMNAYLKYAMRMSPERIILGEIRAQEAESSLLAMNSGHKGFISTLHANSAKDTIERLCLLFKIYSNKDLSYELVLALVTSNIDYVIFIENKEVKEIIEVYGSEKEKFFYESIYKKEGEFLPPHIMTY